MGFALRRLANSPKRVIGTGLTSKPPARIINIGPCVRILLRPLSARLRGVPIMPIPAE
jgi:hypothetical protein